MKYIVLTRQDEVVCEIYAGNEIEAVAEAKVVNAEAFKACPAQDQPAEHKQAS